MAFDGFMWFVKGDGTGVEVKGETLDKTYQSKGAFSLKSFSVDCENPTSVGTSSGGFGTAKAKLNPFKVSKNTDSCTTGMYLTCCFGGHYKEAHIVVRKAGEAKSGAGAGVEYLHFVFHRVFVTNMEWSGESEDELPSENIQFAYGALEIQYVPQTSLGKGQAATMKSSWNQISNSEDVEIKEFSG